MVEKMWPALKSCKHQSYQAKDQLNQLPDDLLPLIISFLTMKQAAKTSVLSRKWNHLWRCFPVLIFENFAAMRRMDYRDEETILQERANFVKWVNGVLVSHLGRTIDELRVAFYFDSSCQAHIDKWVVFALAKQAKRLELDFTTLACVDPPKWNMSLYQPHNVSTFKSCLRSLCLKYVDITTEDVDCLLRTCMVLEDLCIVYSQSLSYVRACGSPLQLKHLKVSACRQLRTIDILAPKLLSLQHTGSPIELHIRNASLLSEVSVGSVEFQGDVVAYAFDSLSKYSSQLEYLSWQMRLWCVAPIAECNLGINKPPAMTNLKHLKLDVRGMYGQSLLGWADLIEASPLLERLTVMISLCINYSPRRRIVKRNKCPLKSLKTLELCGDLGYPIDLEFATYVIENSIMLKDVILDFRPILHYVYYSRSEPMTYVQDHVSEIKRIVPQGCKVHAVYGGTRKRYLEKFP